jgi:hypothetical protein
LRLPEDGGTPVEPPFVPYEEPWDEGLIIEDDVFAAMLSPEGTIQIEDKIFHLDLPNGLVSYIPESVVSAMPSAYDEFLVAPPTAPNPNIRYFAMTEDVLDAIAAGDTGSPSGTTTDALFTIRLGSGIGCGAGADREYDKEHRYYASNRRLDCKVVYQTLGIYHSIVAKAHHQKKTWYGAWLGSPATIYIYYDTRGILATEVRNVFRIQFWFL